VAGRLDPVGDRDVVETELILKDLESVEKRRERAQKNAKAAGKVGELAKAELSALDRVKTRLERGFPLRSQDLREEERAAIADLSLLTAKPVVYIANVDEGQLARPDERVEAVQALARAEGHPCVAVCGRTEAEIAELPEPDRRGFLAGLGLGEPGLSRLVRACHAELGLITFFTVGENECRATTLRAGARAPRAAGAIHSDFERGFIKAEVMRVDDLLALGSEHAVREKGLARVEGKEYVVEDGDVLRFRFAT
jgi:GTP-binding protein YchF